MQSFKTSTIDFGGAFEPSAATPARGGLAPWQVRTLNAHIDANLDQDIPIEALAALVRLSVSHFGKAFKQSFGRSPHAHLIVERIERAQTLMLSTAEPLAQIAIAVGLADQSHLSRLFRKVTGESPFAWRRARWTPAGAGVTVQ
jgi:transcriptional regulator GlxA family with amidase domain